MHQNYETKHRIPEGKIRVNEKTGTEIEEFKGVEPDPYYEIYVQKLIPKSKTCFPHRYRTFKYMERKKEMLCKRRDRALGR